MPLVEQNLADAEPKTRLAGVQLLRLILIERRELLPAGINSVPKWRIPAVLVPLVQRSRRDEGETVKEAAATVDDAELAGGGGGAGGGFF